MKKLMMVLTGLLFVVLMAGCSDNGEQPDSENENAGNLLAFSSENPGEGSTVVGLDDFNPEEYDLILRDDDDWYLLLNYQSSRGSRTYCYSGIVYATRGSQEFTKDAWLVYDNLVQSISVTLESPFNNTDMLHYVVTYDSNLGDGYEFTGSYAWRDYGYGYRLNLDFIQGRLGTITPPEAESKGRIVFKEAKLKEFSNFSE